jgi:hypothetical protein
MQSILILAVAFVLFPIALRALLGLEDFIAKKELRGKNE